MSASGRESCRAKRTTATLRMGSCRCRNSAGLLCSDRLFCVRAAADLESRRTTEYLPKVMEISDEDDTWKAEVPLVQIRGRGALSNPSSRFETLAYLPDRDALDDEERENAVPTQFLRDSSRSVITRNRSPDVGFDFSVNPYRGCEHGCVYCYARPTHEYLGFSAGLDFETRILVKEDAPELLRARLASPRWRPVTVAMSGVTDPYQPAERRLQLTRRCIKVLAEFRNPLAIITKNHLVTRDADLLARLAAHDAVAVFVSVTSLDEVLRRKLEPRTSTAARRLDAIRQLSEAGIRTGVLVAPVIPGLTDHEMPAIIAAAAAAGAQTAGYTPVRLPHGVAEQFGEWLSVHYPDRREKVLGRIREIRGGALNDARFGTRMRGQGPYAAQLRGLFRAACRKAGFEPERQPLNTGAFRRPAAGPQLGLFGE